MALRLYGENIDKIEPSLRPAWAAVSEMLVPRPSSARSASGCMTGSKSALVAIRCPVPTI